MKFFKIMLGTAILVLGTASITALADGHLENAIKARKAVMQLRAYSLGQLGAMAKGEVEYDAAAATAAANNLLALANLDQSTMWPQGTDNASMPGKTRALPEIWSTYPAVVEKAKAMVTAAEAMAAAAGTDLASLQGAMGDVGKACGGCHKPFQAPQ